MTIRKILPFLFLSVCLLTALIFQNTIPTFKGDDSVMLPVLMYHSILDDTSKASKYVITANSFEEDLKFLKNNGYQSVTAVQLIKYVNLCEPLPKKPVLITFDDGMYNNLYYALPLLAKYDFSAIFSVVGSYTDEYTKNKVVNPNYSYLTWSDISSLAGNPHIEFGNHSYNFHTISPNRFGTQKNNGEATLDYINVFYSDTQKLQSEFLSNCNFKPVIYTYPFGSFSEESFKVLKKMGFMISLSCTEGINKITHNPDCLFMLKRYNRDGTLPTWKFFSKIKI